MTVRELPTRALIYALEIEIDAAPSATWTALTEETNAWWLPDFHMVAPDSVVTLDARAGGLLLERREDGGSLAWYQVQHCVPGETLHMVGHVSADFGGPATTMLTLSLEAHGDGTLLRVRDSIVGVVEESTVRSLETGWRQLFADGLGAHVAARSG